MTSPGPDWVEQARRLVTGLATEHPAAGNLAGALGGLFGGATTGAPDRHDESADCRWCPVCTGLAALRGRRPDLVDGLADVLVAAAEALRAQAGTGARSTPDATAPDATAPDAAAPGPAGTDRSTPDDGAREPGAPASTEEPVPHPHPRTARVQRIDVA